MKILQRLLKFFTANSAESQEVIVESSTDPHEWCKEIIQTQANIIQELTLKLKTAEDKREIIDEATPVPFKARAGYQSLSEIKQKAENLSYEEKSKSTSSTMPNSNSN